MVEDLGNLGFISPRRGCYKGLQWGLLAWEVFEFKAFRGYGHSARQRKVAILSQLLNGCCQGKKGKPYEMCSVYELSRWEGTKGLFMKTSNEFFFVA